MTSSAQRQCRERTLAKLLEADPDPKIYPILPISAELDMVCVWQIDDDLFIGDYAEFSALALGYHERTRVLYFTVARDFVASVLNR